MSPEVAATMRAALLSGPALLLGAMLADWLLGEPPPALHPVVWMGGVTRAALRAVTSRRPLGQLAAGAVIALGVPSLFAGGAALGLRAVARGAERVPGAGIGGLVTFVVAVWLLKSTFALRALGAAARTVAVALGGADLGGARRGLGSLCSRDAAALDERALIAGAIESLAENASDSVIAPLFYFALFGLPGAVFYRAVNTLDAMIGYHGRYEYLGKAAARLDDLLNLAPARLTSLLLLIAGGLLGLDARRGWRVLRRDGGRTESPNAGHPMAAMAGLLGVALEKRGHYRLGDPDQPLAPASIALAWRVVVLASVLAVAIVVAIAIATGAGATALQGQGQEQGQAQGQMINGR